MFGGKGRKGGRGNVIILGYRIFLVGKTLVLFAACCACGGTPLIVGSSSIVVFTVPFV